MWKGSSWPRPRVCFGISPNRTRHQATSSELKGIPRVLLRHVTCARGVPSGKAFLGSWLSGSVVGHAHRQMIQEYIEVRKTGNRDAQSISTH